MLGSQMEVNNTVRASSMYFRGVLLLFKSFLCVLFRKPPDRLI